MKIVVKLKFISKNCVANESMLITDSNDSIFKGDTTLIKVPEGNRLLCYLYMSAILPIIHVGKHNLHIFSSHNSFE